MAELNSTRALVLKLRDAAKTNLIRGNEQWAWDLRDAANTIEELERKNRELYKKAYLTITIPKWLRRR